MGACWVEIEEPDLIDDCCTNESGRFGKLRANFHAQATRDAACEGIGLLLHRRIDARAGAQIISPVYGNPGLHLLQVLEQHASIYSQVTYDREPRQRFETNRLFELVDEGGARHGSSTIDSHGA